MRALRGGLLVLSSLLAAGSQAAKEPTVKEWLDGPVRYIASPEEIKGFKRLKDDRDRASFIESFWRKRDPTPQTLANEYRQLFRERVKEANEKFLDSAAPGWKTDRGKIYILHGPPEEVREDPNMRTESGATAGSGLIRWTYSRPAGQSGLDPVVYVAFVRNTSGEYKLSYDPVLASPFFNWNDDSTRLAGLGDFMSLMHQTSSRSPLDVMLDLGRMQEVPPQEEILIESVEAVETFAFDPLPLSLDRFEPKGGGTLVVATVAVPGAAEVPPATVMGRFSRKGAKEGARLLGEGSFRVEGAGAARVVQSRVVLEPGTWDVTLLAVDPVTGSNRVYRGTIDPLPPGTLRTSDVVLARTLEPLPYATQASYDAPYIVGGFRVTPLVGTSLPRGEPVQLFYEIYGGTAPFHLSYQLEGQENDGRWRALGKPQESDSTEKDQGFALPTSTTWPTGAYRVRITIRDASGLTLERDRAFRLDSERGQQPN
ncbi:MAG TPA: GWxTD domain-containing protein [Candidatus Polarisedimenticolaceae bacterium]|nr:GWxTD domain-containing protein [Candidatus Polarisedimenticolaceae bacterium]